MRRHRDLVCEGRRQDLGARRAIRPDGQRAQHAQPRRGWRGGRRPARTRASGSRASFLSWGRGGRRQNGATLSYYGRPCLVWVISGRCRPPSRAHGFLCTGAGSLPHSHRNTGFPLTAYTRALRSARYKGSGVRGCRACAVHGQDVN